jgi:hypothetical protein
VCAGNASWRGGFEWFAATSFGCAWVGLDLGSQRAQEVRGRGDGRRVSSSILVLGLENGLVSRLLFLCGLRRSSRFHDDLPAEKKTRKLSRFKRGAKNEKVGCKSHERFQWERVADGGCSCSERLSTCGGGGPITNGCGRERVFGVIARLCARNLQGGRRILGRELGAAACCAAGRWTTQ